MSCFGCCDEDDMHKAAGNGPYMTTHSAGEVLFWVQAFDYHIIACFVYDQLIGQEKSVCIGFVKLTKILDLSVYRVRHKIKMKKKVKIFPSLFANQIYQVVSHSS